MGGTGWPIPISGVLALTDCECQCSRWPAGSRMEATACGSKSLPRHGRLGQRTRRTSRPGDCCRDVRRAPEAAEQVTGSANGWTWQPDDQNQAVRRVVHLSLGLGVDCRERYVGGLGVEAAAATAPQRGQWVQVESSGDAQDRHVRGTVEVTGVDSAGVEDRLSSSGSAAIPFLNSFMDFPSDFARSGSLLPPKSTNTITRIRSSSW